MKYFTRFAPSPTGNLHIGNLRTAIFNFIVAKQSRGKFILRLDDTDSERSNEKYVSQIKYDLEWLGIEWDHLEKQSERIQLYNEALKRLIGDGQVYECFETPAELALKRKNQLASGYPPVYDRSALKLTKRELTELRNNRQSYWRLKLDGNRTLWKDKILGDVSVDTKSISDPVILRGDGQFLYTLASVVDDIEMKVNYVIRGNDHVTNTAVQIQIFKMLESDPPIFCHHSLLVGPKGEPLSKRLNDLSAKELKTQGVEEKAIFLFLSQLGKKSGFSNEFSFKKIVEEFDLADFGTSPTRFDIEALFQLSRKILSGMKFKEISKYLLKVGVPQNIQYDFWTMAKENITNRVELEDLWKLCRDGVHPKISDEEREFLNTCRKLLPLDRRNPNSWTNWTMAIKLATGRSGKNLYLPLREALTGQTHGPDMNKLFPLLQKINL